MSKGKRRPGRFGQHRPQPQALAAAAPQNARSETPSVRTAALSSRAMPTQDPPPGPRSLRKDQQRALIAYEWAQSAKAEEMLGEYKIAVQNFAAAQLRSGLAAAVSVLERSKNRDGFRKLLDDLARWPLPGIDAKSSADWPTNVRGLANISQYMQATRELIMLLTWLLRACRALDPEERIDA